MNAEALFKIVMMDLSSESLKLETELERVINSDMEINDKIQTVKLLLNKIVMTDASLNKFKDMISIVTDNNNNTKQEKNGNTN